MQSKVGASRLPPVACLPEQALATWGREYARAPTLLACLEQFSKWMVPLDETRRMLSLLY
jgi:hypothetical protein